MTTVVPRFDLAAARMGVRRGAVRPPGDDCGEGRSVGPELVEELFQAPSKILLGPVHERFLRQPRECFARDRAGAADQLELSFVLDRPELLDQPSARNELDPAGHERLVRGVRDRVGLEGDPAGEPLGQVGEQGAFGDGELDPFDPARRLRIAEVAEEPHVAGLDEDGGVRALEPGQVADVRRRGDEEWLLEQVTKTVDSIGHLFTRNSSASRYPSGPFPTTRWATRSEITDCRRHSSRSSTLERWTSTTGASNSSTASRIA